MEIKVVNILSNRESRRAQPKKLQKATKDINSLTPAQARVANLVAMERADIIVDRYIQNFETLFDRNMSAALIDFGIGYEYIEGIQGNMAKMLLEDSKKSKKLKEGNFNMAVIEQKVLDEVKEILETQVGKNESIEKLRDKFPRLSRSMLVNAYVKVKKEMGLTENRISKETVYLEFDKNVTKLSGVDMVINVINKFGFTESTAKTYYSKWKKEYMTGKAETAPVLKTHVASTKQVEENAKKMIEAVKERQCIQPVEKEVEVEINKMEVVKVKGTLKIIESNVIVRKTVKVEGANGNYNADTEKGITLSREDMSISFENVEQLDEWISEVKAVFALVV